MLNQKVAFVTGAASGIGLEVAREFAEQGAKVVISDLKEDAAHQAAEELKENGHDAMALACDVTNEGQLTAGIDRTIEVYGQLDILVNNAGLQHVAAIEDFPTEKFELMQKIMVTAPFIAIKKVFSIMRKQGYGRIINMASINGVIGFAGKAAYNTAKHGLIGLSKVAALEGAADGITVNALCPGYVDTPLVQNQLQEISETRDIPVEKVMEEVIYPLVPQHRLLDVQEIADYAVFIASSKAKGITGQAVILDGGYTAQ
nr:3-hydroxybutyrate dehydrogenase [Virgibacillus siamensis]